MQERTRAVYGGVLLLIAAVPNGNAQIRASERARVSQTVDGTTITVDYSRPRIRGRTAVFGNEVKWGEVWTPGANMATTLEVNKNIRINGHPVPSGKYSVWMVVDRGDWTVLLDTTVDRFHTDRPKEDGGLIRFTIRPQRRDRVEVLSWWFPEVRSDGVVLAMQWDKTYVPLTVKVDPSFPLTVSAENAHRIVGEYEMRWVPPPRDSSAPPDSMKPGETDGPPHGVVKLAITYDRGSLWGRVDPAPFPGYNLMVLMPMKEDWFMPGWWMNGELYDASDDMVMEFKIENGRATGFEVRYKNDELMATASRTR